MVFMEYFVKFGHLDLDILCIGIHSVERRHKEEQCSWYEIRLNIGVIFCWWTSLFFFFSPFCFIAKCSIISCCNVDIIINEKKSLCLEFRCLCVKCLNHWCATGIEIQTLGLCLLVLNYSDENSVWKIKKSAKPTKIFLLMLNKEGDCWNQIFKACTSFGRVKCMVKNPELG